MVSILSLNEFSKSILENVSNKHNENKEIIKIIIVKKYLFISELFVVESNKETLFEYIWKGFVCDNKLFIENFSKLKTLINLKPELVDRKEPPIITKIKKIKVKFDELLSNEIPMFETLLVIDISKFKKLLS